MRSLKNVHVGEYLVVANTLGAGDLMPQEITAIERRDGRAWLVTTQAAMVYEIDSDEQVMVAGPCGGPSG